MKTSAEKTGNEKHPKTFRGIYRNLKEPVVKSEKQKFREEIAKATDRSDNCVACWVNGRQIPDLANRIVIAETLKKMGYKSANAKDLFPEAELKTKQQ